ncbi:MAG: type II toxin-antitoxin system RelE/ParE family toxin [Bacteroidota bacterium]|nr:type II toxin-antitoxin system RelE/ParE family toxin [Bacteroidota bacterium]
MALEIEWSNKADKKFDKILDYLLDNWGENATKVFVKKGYDFLDILVEFPQIGSIEHYEKGIRGFTILKQINVFYKLRGNKIILLDFFDNRKDPAKKRF